MPYVRSVCRQRNNKQTSPVIVTVGQGGGSVGDGLLVES